MSYVIAWSDVQLRYPELDKLANATSATTQAGFIQLAEAYVHSRLGGQFTTPFSSNNLTAKDLIVDALYVQNMLTRQPDHAKAVRESLDARINDLLSGKTSMVDSAGVAAGGMVGETVWSNTQNYSPVFGVSNIELSAVSSDQLQAEADARGDVLSWP